MPPFKDEHILIIAPGSQTTLAQLGLPESFTPARFRFPTRMFPSAKKGEWEPYKVRQRLIKVKKPAPAATTEAAPAPETADTAASTAANGEEQKKDEQDMDMKDAPEGQAEGQTEDKGGEDGAKVEQPAEKEVPMIEEEQLIYEEDSESDEGATYPIRSGTIVDWPCFFAVLTHIYNALSPPFHTPIMLIAEPAWTARDREKITQFIFEKFKAPAFCMMDSALAVCYAYGTANAIVVDVGYEKADVTAVTDFVVNEHGRGIALEGCGGEAMTGRLLELLSSKGFTRDMCEQLKKSSICEILPANTPLPASTDKVNEAMEQASSNPALPQQQPPGKGPDMPRDTGNGEGEEEEGVVDVATIVTGDPNEYLAKREREKADKAAARKGSTDANAPKAVRLPNAKKEQASFQYEEVVNIESQDDVQNGTSPFIRQRRDVEVGVERFLSVTPSESSAAGFGILDKLAAQVHRTVHAVPDAPKRSELWDSLIILGNGSKIKGFPQTLLSTLTQKYVLSPSSGTIFTSEIPSTLSTPLPTGGTTTPANPQNPGPQNHPAAHGVNPLLVAATQNNMNPNAGSMSSDPNALVAHHRSTGHSQTPTSVKQLKPPEYFPEWKPQSSGGGGGGGGGGTGNNNANGASGGSGNPPPSGGQSGGQSAGPSTGAGGPGAGNTSRGGGGANIGMEEATFLGAQVAAKVVFVVDQGLSKGFLGRVEYNEAGPTAIHDYSL